MNAETEHKTHRHLIRMKSSEEPSHRNWPASTEVLAAFTELQPHLDVAPAIREYLVASGRTNVTGWISRVAERHLAEATEPVQAKIVSRQMGALGNRVLSMQGQIDRVEASVLNVAEKVSDLPRVLPASISALQFDGDFTPLRQSIQVVLEQFDDEDWLATWVEGDISATGASVSAALQNLKLDLAAVFDDLISTDQAELGTSVRNTLDLLRWHLGK